MNVLEQAQTLPLQIAEDGTIRIANSRVSLDSIIYHFKLGASAEQIAEKFPSVRLGDIYGAISFYLNNLEKIEDYLQKQEIDADIVWEEIESNPNYQTNIAELRRKILSRWENRS